MLVSICVLTVETLLVSSDSKIAFAGSTVAVAVIVPVPGGETTNRLKLRVVPNVGLPLTGSTVHTIGAPVDVWSQSTVALSGSAEPSPLSSWPRYFTPGLTTSRRITLCASSMPLLPIDTSYWKWSQALNQSLPGVVG